MQKPRPPRSLSGSRAAALIYIVSQYRPGLDALVGDLAALPLDRVEACYPLGPIFEGAALNVTVMSHLDTLHIGVLGCPAATPNVDLFVTALQVALRRIGRFADQRHTGSWTRRRKGSL